MQSFVIWYLSSQQAKDSPMQSCMGSLNIHVPHSINSRNYVNMKLISLKYVMNCSEKGKFSDSRNQHIFLRWILTGLMCFMVRIQTKVPSTKCLHQVRGSSGLELPSPGRGQEWSAWFTVLLFSQGVHSSMKSNGGLLIYENKTAFGQRSQFKSQPCSLARQSWTMLFHIFTMLFIYLIYSTEGILNIMYHYAQIMFIL